MEIDDEGFDASFYEWIGRALSAWSGVEAALSWLFGACVDIRVGPAGAWVSSGMSNLIIHAGDSMSQRIKLTDAILREVLSRTHGVDAEQQAEGARLLGIWDTLRKPLGKDLIERRNKIAHWQVYVVSDNEGRRLPHLVPTHSHPRFMTMLRADDRQFDEAFVRDSARHFAKMQRELSELADEVTVSELPLNAILYNIRAVMHLADVDIEAICEALRQPYRGGEPEDD